VIPESAALRCGVRARILEELLRVPGYDWGRLGTTHGAVVTVIGDHYGLYGRGLPLDTDLGRVARMRGCGVGTATARQSCQGP
jgi:hypothetical protein